MKAQKHEKEEKHAIIPVENTALTTFDDDDAGDEGFDNSDILVPKILLMQGLSKLVADENVAARMGEFRDSVEGRLLGDMKHPLDVIIFKTFKTWVTFEEKDGAMAYSHTEPFTLENHQAPWEEIVGGVKIRRDKTFNFYCLLTSDIAKGSAFPYAFSLRRTSATTAGKIASIAARLKNTKNGETKLRQVVISLTTTKRENEKGVFYAFDASLLRTATEAEQTSVLEWSRLLKASTVRLDDSDISKEATTTQHATPGAVSEEDRY